MSSPVSSAGEVVSAAVAVPPSRSHALNSSIDICVMSSGPGATNPSFNPPWYIRTARSRFHAPRMAVGVPGLPVAGSV